MALTDVAIEKIKTMILDGRLKPGDKLPREADLADQLGISRSPLREAVSVLSMLRILDVRRGDGTYVTSLTPDLLLETMSFIIDFHQDSGILDLFEVRRALEPMAAEKAALLMTADDVADLLALTEAVDVDSPVGDVVANDLEFHHRIAHGRGQSGVVLADRQRRRTHPPGPHLAGGRLRRTPSSRRSASTARSPSRSVTGNRASPPRCRCRTSPASRTGSAATCHRPLRPRESKKLA